MNIINDVHKENEPIGFFGEPPYLLSSFVNREYWHPGHRGTPFACLARKRVVCFQKWRERERVTLWSLQNFKSQILWVGDSHSCKRERVDPWCVSKEYTKSILGCDLWQELTHHSNMPTLYQMLRLPTQNQTRVSQWSFSPSKFIGVLFYLSQLP